MEQAHGGVEWVKTSWSVEPRWTAELDQKLIEEELKTRLSPKRLDVTFLAQGAFNKAHTVHADGESLVLRVSLPVDPGYKTASEVATLDWLRHNMTLSVPRVIAHDDTQENNLRYEWILMTKIPGTPLSDVWRVIDFEAKRPLVHCLALFMSDMFQKQWHGIGNIYSKQDDAPSVQVGRIVSMFFFWGNRLQQRVSRGPFRTSREWMEACTSLLQGECKSILSESKDEDELEDAETTLGILHKLQRLLDTVFPDDELPEPTILHHGDLTRHNIMVDEDGSLTGILDWECVSAVPFWKACSYPTFLESRNRQEKSERERYKPGEDGEPNSLYWEHLDEYELIILRDHFLSTMQALQPQWVEVYRTSQLQRDFELALLHSDSELSARRIDRWIGEVLGGSTRPLGLFD